MRLCLFSLQGFHDDVIKSKHFPRYWPFVRGIHRSPVNSPHKGQWRGAVMFPLICVWINGWVNNREAGDLRSYCAHYDVIVMLWLFAAIVCRCVSVKSNYCTFENYLKNENVPCQAHTGYQMLWNIIMLRICVHFCRASLPECITVTSILWIFSTYSGWTPNQIKSN